MWMNFKLNKHYLTPPTMVGRTYMFCVFSFLFTSRTPLPSTGWTWKIH